MNLHRTNGRPDWENIAAKRRNFFQRLAAASRSYLTPGNALTLIGFGLVIIGLVCVFNDQYWLGAALLVVGRLLDIADGWIADKTGTKSPLGESLDAGFDKLGTLLTIIVLAACDIASTELYIALALPQVIIAGYAGYMLWRYKMPHPSRLGKLSMAAAWVCLPTSVIVADTRSQALAYFMFAAAVASFVLGMMAALSYMRRLDDLQTKSDGL